MKSRAFTLIELLIVVAIIAILAAIAVPNFLEAQTRSKMSRALADLNSYQTAIEAYSVDHNVYPRMTWGDAPYFDLYEGQGSPLQPIYGTLGPWISTPVAYISQFDLIDPFGSDQRIQADARMYTYHDIKTGRFILDVVNNGTISGPTGLYAGPTFEDNFGAYAQMSIGPDRNIGDFLVQYDPTNGTVSSGNIWVSQKTRERRAIQLAAPAPTRQAFSANN